VELDKAHWSAGEDFVVRITADSGGFLAGGRGGDSTALIKSGAWHCVAVRDDAEAA
jgi:hypothetical protein